MALFATDQIPCLDDQVDEVWRQIMAGKRMYVAHLPISADEDVEGGANPLWNVVLDGGMKFE